MKYYTIINEYHDCSCACLLEINWDVEQITKTSTAEGFIVQKFTRKLTPHNILSVNEYCDISYFEAWRVKNGRVYYEDNNIENRRFKYVIGYHRYENKLETFAIW